MHDKGTGATEIAKHMGIARSTVYKIINSERSPINDDYLKTGKVEL